jgi:hypothetical protein
MAPVSLELLLEELLLLLLVVRHFPSWCRFAKGRFNAHQCVLDGVMPKKKETPSGATSERSYCDRNSRSQYD